jgi:HlyD family secretion protein
MPEESSTTNTKSTHRRIDASKQKAMWDPMTHIANEQQNAHFKSGDGKRSELFIVTSVRAWIALSFFILLITGIVVWVLTGNVVEVVNGDGMLIGRTSLYSVTSSSSARVVELKAKPGQEVRAGDLLAQLDPTELDMKITGARTLHDLQLGENERLTQSDLQELEQVFNKSAKEIQKHEADIGISTRLIESHGRQMELQKDLLDRGLVTLEAFLETQSQVLTLEEKIYSARAGIAESTLATTAAQQSFETELASRLEDLSKSDAVLNVLVAQREQQNKIYSPVDGVVVAVDVDLQEFITSGQQVVRIETGASSEKTLHCLAYMPARMGKRIEEGMRCQLIPEVTYYNEYGYLLGTIHSISEFPATRDDLLMQFGDSAIVDSMLKKQPDGLLVKIELIEDPSTPSGYRWSSEKGFPELLEQGTPTQVRVIYGKVTPIELVSPLLTDYFLGRDPGPGPGGR